METFKELSKLVEDGILDLVRESIFLGDYDACDKISEDNPHLRDTISEMVRNLDSDIRY